MFLSTCRLEPFRSHIHIFYRLQLYATVFGLRKRHKTRLQQRKDKRFKLNTFQTTFTWIETKKKESTKNRIRKYIRLKDDTGKKNAQTEKWEAEQVLNREFSLRSECHLNIYT